LPGAHAAPAVADVPVAAAPPAAGPAALTAHAGPLAERARPAHTSGRPPAKRRLLSQGCLG
jgi:hypothetical protein